MYECILILSFKNNYYTFHFNVPFGLAFKKKTQKQKQRKLISFYFNTYLACASLASSTREKQILYLDEKEKKQTKYNLIRYKIEKKNTYK